jgi:uncharacterized membrane protein YecN with MAPEG domain
VASPATEAYLLIFGLLLAALAVRLALRSRDPYLGRGTRSDSASRVLGRFVGGSPIGFILMIVLETRGHHPAIVHVIGSSVILGRVLFAFAPDPTDPESELYRMQRFLTWIGIAAGGAYAAWLVY